MKRICSILFASTLTVLAAMDCAGAPAASAATLARTRAHCLSDDVSGDEAVSACTAAIAKTPKDARLYLRRGLAWSQTGDYDYAIGDFSKAIRLDPRDGLALYHLGIAREKKGELQESLVDFNRYAELRPFDPDVRTAIERVTDTLAAAEAAARATTAQTASAAIAEHFGEPTVARVEPTKETAAPTPPTSAPDGFLLVLPAVLLLAGATAAAMLARKRGKRRADAAPPHTLETDPLDPGARADRRVPSPGEPRP